MLHKDTTSSYSLDDPRSIQQHHVRVENGLQMATGARQLELGTAVSCLAPKPALSCRGHPEGKTLTDFVT